MSFYDLSVTFLVKTNGFFKAVVVIEIQCDSKYVSSKTATGLAIAFGESCFLRKLCMPLLVPLKLWLTYEILVMTNKSIIKKENEDLK